MERGGGAAGRVALRSIRRLLHSLGSAKMMTWEYKAVVDMEGSWSIQDLFGRQSEHSLPENPDGHGVHGEKFEDPHFPRGGCH